MLEPQNPFRVQRCTKDVCRENRKPPRCGWGWLKKTMSRARSLRHPFFNANGCISLFTVYTREYCATIRYRWRIISNTWIERFLPEMFLQFWKSRNFDFNCLKFSRNTLFKVILIISLVIYSLEIYFVQIHVHQYSDNDHRCQAHILLYNSKILIFQIKIPNIRKRERRIKNRWILDEFNRRCEKFVST